MNTTRHTWTEALNTVTEAAGGNADRARHALGTLLDEDLELPQADDTERIITGTELARALDRLHQDGHR